MTTETETQAEQETIVRLAARLQNSVCHILNENEDVVWVQLRAVLLAVAGLLAASVRHTPGAVAVDYKEFNNAVTSIFHQQLRLALEVQQSMDDERNADKTDLHINKPDQTLN